MPKNALKHAETTPEKPKLHSTHILGLGMAGNLVSLAEAIQARRMLDTTDQLEAAQNYALKKAKYTSNARSAIRIFRETSLTTVPNLYGVSD